MRTAGWIKQKIDWSPSSNAEQPPQAENELDDFAEARPAHSVEVPGEEESPVHRFKAAVSSQLIQNSSDHDILSPLRRGKLTTDDDALFFHFGFPN